MPNWCNTSLVFEGDKQEIKTLYQTMKKLERRKKPLIENGFGTNWLGCLVEALGSHWKEIYCRGTWFSLKCQGNILRMETETAWSPCIETYDFICKVFSVTDLLLPLRRTDDGGIPYKRHRGALFQGVLPCGCNHSKWRLCIEIF